MLKNLTLKILSILISLSLWFIVSTSDITEMKMYVPVKLDNIPEGYTVVTDDTLLNIEAKGSNLLLKNISHNDILISIDVSKFGVGEQHYKIKSTDIKSPNGIEVVRVEPQDIFVTVDKLIKKEIKVVPTFIGEPKEGFKVETVNSYPESVTIFGAESSLFDTDFIETLPINLSGRNEAMIYGTGMKMSDGLKTTSPAQVDVFINFSEEIVEETFETYPLEVMNGLDTYQYKISPETVKVRIKGRKDRLNSANIYNNLRLYVDLSEIPSEGKFLREINKNTNEHIKILSMEPQNVRIEVSE